MELGDIIGILIVYGYVAFLLILTEKKLAKWYPLESRKILHILTGNIAFLLPVFVTREIMAFVAAGPFIIFTFLMSPYSPIQSMRGKTSEAGHGLGLVYYAITWTVLAYLFFDDRVVIAAGILAMSYGDGIASLVGVRFGRRKYRIFHDTKSYIGSGAMLLATFAVLIIGMLFYAIPMTLPLLGALAAVAAVGMVVEAATPFGLDNLSVPFVVAFLTAWAVI